MVQSKKSLQFALIGGYLLVFLWSAIRPANWLSWSADNLPALLIVLLLVLTRKKVTFTPLTYVFMWCSVVLVAIGAHYTYEAVPLFNWIREPFGFSRNHFDRFVHLFQGLTGASVVRELLIRKTTLIGEKKLAFLAVCTTLAFSALYEIGESAFAIFAGGQTAEPFLGTQGDIWDTQWDMTFNLLGGICAMLLLSKFQNQQLRRAR